MSQTSFILDKPVLPAHARVFWSFTDLSCAHAPSTKMTAACGNPSWNASEFEKAVGLALSKLNVGGICSLTVHQSRSADCFLSGNREFKIRSLRTTDYVWA